MTEQERFKEDLKKYLLSILMKEVSASTESGDLNGNPYSEKDFNKAKNVVSKIAENFNYNGLLQKLEDVFLNAMMVEMLNAINIMSTLDEDENHD